MLKQTTGGFKSGASTPAQDIAEARQETQIWTACTLTRYLRDGDLQVSVRAGTATLTGILTEEINKDLAREIALGVEGITAVDNRIEVITDYNAPPSTGRRSFGDIVEEATVTAAVRSKLAWTRYADALHVDVTTSRGRVRLIGTANDAESREAAGRLAESTIGVYSVDNQLVIAPGKVAARTTMRTDINDSWITMKVKSILMYSTQVAGADISVSTRAGVVKLAGRVSSDAEGALAIELASHVRAVKSVDSSLLTR